jgi:hypothetical protein
MSNEEVVLRNGKLLRDYVAAKTKLQMLQDVAPAEAKALDGLVGHLKSGGDLRQVAKTLESYLTGTLANLIRDMWAVCIEMEELERRLSGLGIAVPD